MNEIEKLQKHLSLIRKAAGWTAEDLGEKIGTTKQTISNLENEKTKMTKTQYLAIQMVISQKIATSPEDTTLANIMKLVLDTDEADEIDYNAVPNAMIAAENCEKNEAIAKDNKAKDLAGGAIVGSAVGSAVGLSGAMAMLGLSPVGAVSAAVLGATIAPWLTKAINDDIGKKK